MKKLIKANDIMPLSYSNTYQVPSTVKLKLWPTSVAPSSSIICLFDSSQHISTLKPLFSLELSKNEEYECDITQVTTGYDQLSYVVKLNNTTTPI
jgi:hypothetical protein